MTITVEMVKELRQQTNAGVLEAKRTLEETNGDFDKAVAILRAKGAASAAKRADRTANEGVVEGYVHTGSRVGVLLELNCETDFVARNEQFRDLAHDLALHVAAMSPRYVNIDEIPEDILAQEKERYGSQAQKEGKPPEIVEKIVAGRLNKFYEEHCLMEQPFVKDDNLRVKDLITEAIRTTGENVVIRRFARYELGEAL